MKLNLGFKLKELIQVLKLIKDFLEDEDRQKCERSALTLFIKNLPANSTLKGLRELFDHYG